MNVPNTIAPFEVIWAITAGVGVGLNSFLLYRSLRDVLFVRHSGVNGLSRAISETRFLTDVCSLAFLCLSLMLAVIQMDTPAVTTAYGPVHAQWLANAALYLGAGVPIAAWEVGTIIVVVGAALRFIYRLRVDHYLGKERG